MNHELKILPAYYEAVRDGYKTFEVRLNDRGFQRGDTLTLKEYDPEVPSWDNIPRGYTGRELQAIVSYVHSGLGLQPALRQPGAPYGN